MKQRTIPLPVLLHPVTAVIGPFMFFYFNVAICFVIYVIDVISPRLAVIR